MQPAHMPTGRDYDHQIVMSPSTRNDEGPSGEAEPRKYFLSNLPADSALNDLVAHAHMRWRIERDYHDLKQELGLGHYEGRSWRGFHHHAALTIACGFLVAERLAAARSVGAKKLPRTQSACPSRR